jgi:hypothetical protein
METNNSQVQASPAAVVEEKPAEQAEQTETTSSSTNDVPSYKIGGVFMLTILSFALFLNLFVIGIAILTMPK